MKEILKFLFLSFKSVMHNCSVALNKTKLAKLRLEHNETTMFIYI